jgi:hypothetical protein
MQIISFQEGKAMAPKEFALQGSWRARVASSILNVNLPEWQLKVNCWLSVPPLHRESVQAILGLKPKVMPRIRKHRTPSEKRKAVVTRTLSRKHTSASNRMNLQYKGLITLTLQKSAVGNKDRLEEMISRILKEKDENEDPFDELLVAEVRSNKNFQDEDSMRPADDSNGEFDTAGSIEVQNRIAKD